MFEVGGNEEFVYISAPAVGATKLCRCLIVAKGFEFDEQVGIEFEFEFDEQVAGPRMTNFAATPTAHRCDSRVHPDPQPDFLAQTTASAADSNHLTHGGFPSLSTQSQSPAHDEPVKCHQCASTSLLSSTESLVAIGVRLSCNVTRS